MAQKVQNVIKSVDPSGPLGRRVRPGDALLSVMRLEAESLRGAARYLRITGGLMIFQCVSIVFNSLSRSLRSILGFE